MKLVYLLLIGLHTALFMLGTFDDICFYRQNGAKYSKEQYSR